MYPATPMAVRQPDTISRERAGELIRAWAGGRPGPLGSVLGRQTAVDQVTIRVVPDVHFDRSSMDAVVATAHRLARSDGGRSEACAMDAMLPSCRLHPPCDEEKGDGRDGPA